MNWIILRARQDLGGLAHVVANPKETADYIDRQGVKTKRILENFVQENPSTLNVAGATALATAVDVGRGIAVAVRDGPGTAADLFDRKAEQTKNILGDYVESNPSVAAVIGATTLATMIDLARGDVDTLRLGRGVQQGGWGYAQDGLRLVNAVFNVGATAAGKAAAKQVSRLTGATIAKFISDPGHDICSYITSTQVLRHTRTNIFAGLEQVGRQLGFETVEAMAENAPRSMSEVARRLRLFNAEVKYINTAKSEAELVRQIMGRPNGVVLLGLDLPKAGKSIGGHTVYAYRDVFGRFKLVDRACKGRLIARTFESLSEYQRAFGIKASIREAAYVRELAMVSDPVKQVATLAAPVNAVVLTHRSDRG